MTSIRAPWRQRPPRDGIDGLDARSLPGAPGTDGADGEAGRQGSAGTTVVVREAAANDPLQPWRAPYERHEHNRLTYRVTAGPMGAAAVVELIPVRDEFDDIRYVDILPLQ